VSLGEEIKVWGTLCKLYSVINMIMKLLKEDIVLSFQIMSEV
jgi:hypothetical protein